MESKIKIGREDGQSLITKDVIQGAADLSALPSDRVIIPHIVGILNIFLPEWISTTADLWTASWHGMTSR